MALAVSNPNDRKRVKVYELRNNDWFDCGTGFCTGQILHVRFSPLPSRLRLLLVHRLRVAFFFSLSFFFFFF